MLCIKIVLPLHCTGSGVTPLVSCGDADSSISRPKSNLECLDATKRSDKSSLYVKHALACVCFRVCARPCVCLLFSMQVNIPNAHLCMRIHVIIFIKIRKLCRRDVGVRRY